MDKGYLEQKIISVLESVYDPEIPVNIYELGMIYDIKIKNENDVEIIMTLTSPACPVAESLPGEVREKVKSIEEKKPSMKKPGLFSKKPVDKKISNSDEFFILFLFILSILSKSP